MEDLIATQAVLDKKLNQDVTHVMTDQNGTPFVVTTKRISFLTRLKIAVKNYISRFSKL